MEVQLNNRTEKEEKTKEFYKSQPMDKLINNTKNLAKLGRTLFKHIFENTINQKSFAENLSYHQTTNSLFIDDSFPPNDNSLIKGHKIKNGCIPKKWSKIKWVRAKEVFSNFFIFNEPLEANEIKQGALNNSYFLSVLSALSESPERIKKIFLTENVNSPGLYGIKLYVDGVLQEVLIDDYFPVDGTKLISCFSSGRDGSLWVQIIEKCFAKVYGSYYKIERGLSQHVMRDLTGAPTVIIENTNDNLLNILKEACEKRWLITALSSETEEFKDMLKEVGIIPMNSYTVLDLHELAFDSENQNLTTSCNLGSIEFILKLRNPWGKNEWVGDWSDFSSLMKTNLNITNSNGCFFMNFKDFKHFFSKIQICKVNDNYLYQSISLKQNPNSYALVKLNIESDNYDYCIQPLFISIIQQDKRKSCLGLDEDLDKYFNSRIILNKINKKEGSDFDLEYIGGKQGREREVCEEWQLNAGEYLVFCEIDWSPKNNFSEFMFLNNEYPFVISTYSPHKIQLSVENIDNYPDILNKIYQSSAKKNGEFIRFTNESAPDCYKYASATPEGYAYVYFENLEKDATLLEDVKYTKFEGLKLMPPFKGTSYNVKVGPGESNIVLIKQIDSKDFNLVYSYHSNFLFGPQRLLELTKLKGKISYRKDTKLNIDVDIVVSTFKYSLGLCFYYENRTSDRKLEETLKIRSTGVEIVDSDCKLDNIIILLGPGEKKLIELRAKKNNWSVQSSVSYKIESL